MTPIFHAAQYRSGRISAPHRRPPCRQVWLTRLEAESLLLLQTNCRGIRLPAGRLLEVTDGLSLRNLQMCTMTVWPGVDGTIQDLIVRWRCQLLEVADNVVGFEHQHVRVQAVENVLGRITEQGS